MSSTQQLLLGEGAGSSVPVYIEEVFSTYLFTGTGTSLTQRIASGLDMSTKGGMVWTKNRTEVTDHQIYDTARGERKYIRSNTTDAEFDSGANSVQYKTSGWDAFAYVNEVSKVMASWTFRKQPKFFDVVTYTGDGTARAISHNLGSVPGCMLVKCTSAAANWNVYHTSVGNGSRLLLNDTTGTVAASTTWNNTSPTATEFTVGTSSQINFSGATYVAYLFAHDAGGFGLTGTDNVISCGSFTTNGSGNATISLGYEPQWLLQKDTINTGNWFIPDIMRGMTVSGGAQLLRPNLDTAESTSAVMTPTATGFEIFGFVASTTYIYIAIRRGPMKVPTVGTNVFVPVQYVSSTSLPLLVTTGFPVDMIVETIKGPAGQNRQVGDRLRGTSMNVYRLLDTDNNGVENTGTFTNAGYNLANNTGYQEGFISAIYGAGYNCITWNFRRAPSFFDEVCYTGTGVIGQVVNHNLGVAPELVISMCRLVPPSYSQDYNYVYVASRGINATLGLNSASYNGTSIGMFSAAPTATQLTLRNVGGDGLSINYSSGTYVAYLFATCAGVSKVGSYTGTGGSQSIACGFTGGARFVLIKRTDSTGDWWVWDSSRGMVSGTDPRIGWNIQTGESNNNWVFTEAGGFQIVTTDASVNASGGTYIFLAIA
jgi:hypothetical protein